MRAAVLRAIDAPMEIEEIAISKPRSREVLVRTQATGVCHTDLSYATGLQPAPLPAVLGHESCGVVEQVGDEVTLFRPGDRVITTLATFCGHCPVCSTGHLYLCESPERDRAPGDEPRLRSGDAPLFQFARLGAFAEQMLVHENACVKMPEEMPAEAGALLGCGVLTGAGAIFNTAAVRPGQAVVVIGCGGVGLSAINAAAIAGAGRVIAVDLQAEKEELARHFGATDFVSARGIEAVGLIRELTRGGADFAVEAVGHSSTVEQAFQMIRRGGTAIVLGMMPRDMKITLPGVEFVYDKSIKGSTLGSSRFPYDIPRLIDFYLQGRLKLDRLVSDIITLDQVDSAMRSIGGGQVARSVVKFD